MDITGYDYQRMKLSNLLQFCIKKWMNSLPKHTECIDDIMSCMYLTNLNAERIYITQPTWTYLAHMLKTNTSLQWLNFSHNNIADHEVVNMISDALTVNTCLQTLLLKFGNLVKSHADCIIKSLLSNKTLHHLDLSNNFIKEVNIKVA